MYLVVTRSFPPELGGMQSLMWGLGFHMLSRLYVRVRTMQRLIGKSGFGQYFRICCRSVYDRMNWFQAHEAAERPGGVLLDSVRDEIVAFLIVLPLTQLSATDLHDAMPFLRGVSLHVPLSTPTGSSTC